MTEISPFTYVNSISETKQYLDDLSGYNSYMINMALSLNTDCLIDANMMNINHHLPVNMQYDYYFHSIRKAKRYGKKWPKPTKTENLEAVIKFYKYNREKAKQALTILSDDDLKKIKKLLETGGVTK
jgi:hypothetical protein